MGWLLPGWAGKCRRTEGIRGTSATAQLLRYADAFADKYQSPRVVCSAVGLHDTRRDEPDSFTIPTFLREGWPQSPDQPHPVVIWRQPGVACTNRAGDRAQRVRYSKFGRGRATHESDEPECEWRRDVSDEPRGDGTFRTVTLAKISPARLRGKKSSGSGR